jgi:hypothetical protein
MAEPPLPPALRRTVKRRRKARDGAAPANRMLPSVVPTWRRSTGAPFSSTAQAVSDRHRVRLSTQKRHKAHRLAPRQHV